MEDADAESVTPISASSLFKTEMFKRRRKEIAEHNAHTEELERKCAALRIALNHARKRPRDRADASAAASAADVSSPELPAPRKHMDNRRVVPWITKGSNVITTVTQGVTPPGPRGKKKNVAPLSFFLSTLIVTVLVTKNFLFFYGLNCH